MTARLASAVLAVLLALVVVPAAPAAAAPAAPSGWTDGPCAADDNVGITVVIDFQELGGGVNVRCAEGPVADGADALDQAGVNWQGVVRWGRGFVCKIAGKPSNDPCIDTPPASAYWSYWVAPRGGSWCYANFGVLNRTPPPGSVEGWSFSLDRQDGSSPAPRSAPPKLAPGQTPNPLPGNDCDPSGPDVAEPVTTTTTRPRPGTDPATPTTRPGGLGATPGQPGTPTTAATQTPGAATTSTTRPGATTTTTTPGSATTTTVVRADDGSGADDPSGTDEPGDGEQAVPSNEVDLSTDGQEQEGFPLSTAVGVALVAALGAGAVLAQRRRRSGPVGPSA